MKVISNEKITEDVFVLTILDRRIATTAKPGQFVNIRVTPHIKFMCGAYFPLLRRPLSVYSVEGESFKILYKIVGEGTRILSTYEPGAELDIIGPLGNYFASSDYKSILVVAGGIGVAPLYFLTSRLAQNLTTEIGKPEVTTLIGAKTKAEVLCEEEFAEFSKVIVTTEDGSYGIKGVVTDLLTPPHPEIIFACGPIGMLKVVKSYAHTHFIPCQVSLECHMACGIGVCLGCAVPVKNGYKYVCKDGPVFWTDEVEL